MLMRELNMNKQADLLLVEEFSEQELEAISGGQQQKQDGLVNVAVQDVTVNVAVVALSRAVGISQQD
jgi:hypothetical protein